MQACLEKKKILSLFFASCFIQSQMICMPMGNKVTRLKEQYDNYKKLDYSYYKPGPISPYYRKVITINGFSCVLINAVHKVSHPQLFSMIYVYAYLTSPGTGRSVKLGGSEIWQESDETIC